MSDKQHTYYEKYDDEGDLTREHMELQDKLDNITNDYVKAIGKILSYYYKIHNEEWNIGKIHQVRKSALSTFGLDDEDVY